MFDIKAKEFDYMQIAESGQAFRMYPDGKCIAMDRCCHVEGTHVECPDSDNDFWMHYFDLATDYSTFIEAIDPCDEYLCGAADFGRGIRILCQDPWEMLITFIISQRKSIPAIRSCVEKLCKGFGMAKNVMLNGDSYEYFAFPSPKELASASTEAIAACGLGYRTEYVYLAAKAIAADESILYRLKGLTYDEILSELLRFKGVGVKVANCVALFAYHKIEAFPVDVWIQKVLNEHYNGAFPMDKYKGYAGVMQQYMFFYARKN